MGVVFDEVTGSVEPESRPAGEKSAKPAAADESELKISRLLSKLDERRERLRAD